MTAHVSIPALIAEGRRLIAAATPGPVETSLHEKLTTVGDTNHWTVKEHEFPQPPYEGQLTEEWGVYPPLGEAGPVALVSGPHNAALFVFAVNNLPALLDVAEKTLALFDALDYVTPGWREDTCTPCGYEVNRAWMALERALGQGPDAPRGGPR